MFQSLLASFAIGVLLCSSQAALVSAANVSYSNQVFTAPLRVSGTIHGLAITNCRMVRLDIAGSFSGTPVITITDSSFSGNESAIVLAASQYGLGFKFIVRRVQFGTAANPVTYALTPSRYYLSAKNRQIFVFEDNTCYTLRRCFDVGFGRGYNITVRNNYLALSPSSLSSAAGIYCSVANSVAEVANNTVTVQNARASATVFSLSLLASTINVENNTILFTNSSYWLDGVYLYISARSCAKVSQNAISATCSTTPSDWYGPCLYSYFRPLNLNTVAESSALVFGNTLRFRGYRASALTTRLVQKAIIEYHSNSIDLNRTTRDSTHALFAGYRLQWADFRVNFNRFALAGYVGTVWWRVSDPSTFDSHVTLTANDFSGAATPLLSHNVSNSWMEPSPIAATALCNTYNGSVSVSPEADFGYGFASSGGQCPASHDEMPKTAPADLLARLYQMETCVLVPSSFATKDLTQFSQGTDFSCVNERVSSVALINPKTVVLDRCTVDRSFSLASSEDNTVEMTLQVSDSTIGKSSPTYGIYAFSWVKNSKIVVQDSTLYGDPPLRILVETSSMEISRNTLKNTFNSATDIQAKGSSSVVFSANRVPDARHVGLRLHASPGSTVTAKDNTIQVASRDYSANTGVVASAQQADMVLSGNSISVGRQAGVLKMIASGTGLALTTSYHANLQVLDNTVTVGGHESVYGFVANNIIDGCVVIAGNSFTVRPNASSTATTYAARFQSISASSFLITRNTFDAASFARSEAVRFYSARQSAVDFHSNELKAEGLDGASASKQFAFSSDAPPGAHDGSFFKLSLNSFTASGTCLDLQSTEWLQLYGNAFQCGQTAAGTCCRQQLWGSCNIEQTAGNASLVASTMSRCTATSIADATADVPSAIDGTVPVLATCKPDAVSTTLVQAAKGQSISEQQPIFSCKDNLLGEVTVANVVNVTIVRCYIAALSISAAAGQPVNIAIRDSVFGVGWTGQTASRRSAIVLAGQFDRESTVSILRVRVGSAAEHHSDRFNSSRLPAVAEGWKAGTNPPVAILFQSGSAFVGSTVTIENLTAYVSVAGVENGAAFDTSTVTYSFLETRFSVLGVGALTHTAFTFDAAIAASTVHFSNVSILFETLHSPDRTPSGVYVRSLSGSVFFIEGLQLRIPSAAINARSGVQFNAVTESCISLVDSTLNLLCNSSAESVCSLARAYPSSYAGDTLGLALRSVVDSAVYVHNTALNLYQRRGTAITITEPAGSVVEVTQSVFNLISRPLFPSTVFVIRYPERSRFHFLENSIRLSRAALFELLGSSAERDSKLRYAGNDIEAATERFGYFTATVPEPTFIAGFTQFECNTLNGRSEPIGNQVLTETSDVDEVASLRPNNVDPPGGCTAFSSLSDYATQLDGAVIPVRLDCLTNRYGLGRVTFRDDTEYLRQIGCPAVSDHNRQLGEQCNVVFLDSLLAFNVQPVYARLEALCQTSVGNLSAGGSLFPSEEDLDVALPVTAQDEEFEPRDQRPVAGSPNQQEVGTGGDNLSADDGANGGEIELDASRRFGALAETNATNGSSSAAINKTAVNGTATNNNTDAPTSTAIGGTPRPPATAAPSSSEGGSGWANLPAPEPQNVKGSATVWGTQCLAFVADRLKYFTTGGRAVCIGRQRVAKLRAYSALCQVVPVTGGEPSRLPLPAAAAAFGDIGCSMPPPVDPLRSSAEAVAASKNERRMACESKPAKCVLEGDGGADSRCTISPRKAFLDRYCEPDTLAYISSLGQAKSEFAAAATFITDIYCQRRTNPSDGYCIHANNFLLSSRATVSEAFQRFMCARRNKTECDIAAAVQTVAGAAGLAALTASQAMACTKTPTGTTCASLWNDGRESESTCVGPLLRGETDACPAQCNSDVRSFAVSLGCCASIIQSALYGTQTLSTMISERISGQASGATAGAAGVPSSLADSIFAPFTKCLVTSWDENFRPETAFAPCTQSNVQDGSASSNAAVAAQAGFATANISFSAEAAFVIRVAYDTFAPRFVGSSLETLKAAIVSDLVESVGSRTRSITAASILDLRLSASPSEVVVKRYDRRAVYEELVRDTLPALAVNLTLTHPEQLTGVQTSSAIEARQRDQLAQVVEAISATSDQTDRKLRSALSFLHKRCPDCTGRRMLTEAVVAIGERATPSGAATYSVGMVVLITCLVGVVFAAT